MGAEIEATEANNKVLAAPVPPELAPETHSEFFAPFSILTSEIQHCDQRDPAFVAFRDTVARTVFPDYDNETANERKNHASIASRAAKAVAKLAINYQTYRPWRILESIETAESSGFKVHAGKGVTFEDPKRIRESLENLTNVGPKAAAVLINFARLHTRQ